VCYPIQRVDGKHVGDTLTQFINDYGPEHLTFDGASVQTGPKTRFMQAIQKYEIKYHAQEESAYKTLGLWLCLGL
jgi:hypothetical protein